MYTHKTRNKYGNVTDIPLPLMETQHLKNTVALRLRRLQEAKDRLNISVQTKNINFIAMNVRPEEEVKKAERAIQAINEIIPHYLYECIIRNISTVQFSEGGEEQSIVTILQGIFERTAMVEQIMQTRSSLLYKDIQGRDNDDDEGELLEDECPF